MPIELTPTISEYVLSNGTRVASNTPVLFYSANEILKFEIFGGLALVAIAILTYTLYKYYAEKYALRNERKRRQEIVDRGGMIDPTLRLPPEPKINKKLLYLIGVVAIIGGIIIWIMPS